MVGQRFVVDPSTFDRRHLVRCVDGLYHRVVNGVTTDSIEDIIPGNKPLTKEEAAKALDKRRTMKFVRRIIENLVIKLACFAIDIILFVPTLFGLIPIMAYYVFALPLGLIFTATGFYDLYCAIRHFLFKKEIK